MVIMSCIIIGFQPVRVDSCWLMGFPKEFTLHGIKRLTQAMPCTQVIHMTGSCTCIGHKVMYSLLCTSLFEPNSKPARLFSASLCCIWSSSILEKCDAIIITIHIILKISLWMIDFKNTKSIFVMNIDQWFAICILWYYWGILNHINSTCKIFLPLFYISF